MSLRQVILDTETTGLRVEDGHKILEIGCVELIDRKLTGRYFHQYINPGRDIEAAAIAVHGIEQKFLADKPLFPQIAKPFLDFLENAELIIHNASFDLGFLDFELKATFEAHPSLSAKYRVIDTLLMARQLHVGQRNSLDALCKRYGVDLSKREFHGALLDAHLLAQVYLAMTGGQSSLFETAERKQYKEKQVAAPAVYINRHKVLIIKADDEELALHEQYLANMQAKGPCLWLT